MSEIRLNLYQADREFQMEIGGGGFGYRLFGPKFDGSSRLIKSIILSERDKEEIIRFVKPDAQAVEQDRDQWRDLCTRQGMELKAVEVERDALREDKNRIEKVMQLGCQDSESVCLYWQTVKDWEKECDSLEIKNADLQAALATANQERDELKAEIADMKKHTWCAYCGHEILIDDDAATKISEHIMTCEKHPLHIALAALAAAQGEVERLRVAIAAGVYLADFVAGERDMDKCEDCQVSECCSCCIIVAGRFLKKVPHDGAMEIAGQAQEVIGGKP